LFISNKSKSSPIFSGKQPKEVVESARSAILNLKGQNGWKWNHLTVHRMPFLVRGSRKLPSEDWILSIGSSGWASLMATRSEEWLPTIEPNAFIKTPVFEVAVDLMPRSFDPENEAHRDELTEHNASLKFATGMRWAGRSPDPKTIHGTLLISFRRAADANELLNRSLAIEGRLLLVRRSIRRPSQCHNCQACGHTKIACKAPVRCGRCAAPHSTEECSCPAADEDQRCQGTQECGHLEFKCANCGGHHIASDKACPERKEAFEREGAIALFHGGTFE
ncbi:hypothetical protein V8E36_005731, partial [Tilletia maclaganii]